MNPPYVGGGVFDSNAYDREIQAERRQRERLSRQKARRYGLGDIHPNQLLADKELKRRKAAELAITKPSKPVSVRLPKPRQKPNGRWSAATICNGKLHCRTFDTKAEAERFIVEMKGSN